MPKVLLLLFPRFSEFEITVAASVLRNKYQIDLVAQTGSPIISEAGLQFLPHLTLQQVIPEDYEALILPGGEDLSPVMDDPVVHQLVQTMDQQRKLLAAICAGGIVLAKAGVLRDRPYTVSLYRRFRDFLGCFNESTFRYESLVEAENLLTAQGSAFVDFGLRLGEQFKAIRDHEAVHAYYQGQGDIRWES